MQQKEEILRDMTDCLAGIMNVWKKSLTIREAYLMRQMINTIKGLPETSDSAKGGSRWWLF